MEILTVLPGLLVAILAVSAVIGIIDHRRLRRLADERRGETICHFARSLDYRRLDTKIIRAVYEGLQRHLGTSFPIRASDDIDQVYRIDWEDVDDLANEIAYGCGRSMDGCERNPYYGRVSTVAEMIEFLCAQPSANAVEAGTPEVSTN
jgi:hypothetical protein